MMHSHACANAIRMIASFSAVALLAVVLLAACGKADTTIGSIERIAPQMDSIVPVGAKIEVLAKGFSWSEGPVWIEDGKYLLFTDVPENTIYRWSEEDGKSVFIKPSGPPRHEAKFSRAPGANGLIMADLANHIFMANHGKRAIIDLDLMTRNETVITEEWDGKKFSSPNDLVLASSGSIFFTDPPFGLEGMNDSPFKEQDQNGVYRTDPNGFTHLLISDLDWPNGIDLSPDERTLYVAVSSGNAPRVMAYDLSPEGDVSNGRVFYDFAKSVAEEAVGSPDGLDIAGDGTLFLTGPGGVHVVDTQGTLLGIINTGSRIANVTIGENGTMLYMTAHTKLVRVPILKPADQ